MKIGYIVIIILIAIILYLMFKPTPVQAPLPERVIYVDNIPPTWNYDWHGGPGEDRHRILTERGPYNPRGHVKMR
jgi:hypothetical protein